MKLNERLEMVLQVESHKFILIISIVYHTRLNEHLHDFKLHFTLSTYRSVHQFDGRDGTTFTQGNGATSPVPPSPRLGSARSRQNMRPQLKKQTTVTGQYYKSTPKLFHSASLEKFPGHSSRLQPSLSLGNFPSFKQRRNESFCGTGFSSVESLLEEPENMEESLEPYTNYQGTFSVHYFVIKFQS